jgi:hypothetical protein
VIKIAGVVGEIRFENIEPAIAIVITDTDAHAGLFVTIFAVGASGYYGDVGEGAIVIVVIQNAGLRVDCNINIGPAVVIEIVGNCGNTISRAGLEDTSLF